MEHRTARARSTYGRSAWPPDHRTFDADAERRGYRPRWYGPKSRGDGWPASVVIAWRYPLLAVAPFGTSRMRRHPAPPPRRVCLRTAWQRTLATIVGVRKGHIADSSSPSSHACVEAWYGTRVIDRVSGLAGWVSWDGER